jgi:uncharacterized DUF497 family protein
MADAVHELLITPRAPVKLGARGIRVGEVLQLTENPHTVVRNVERERREIQVRKMLIGRTNGGRTLTLVIEQTFDPTTWLVITGWESTNRERKMLGR